MALLASLASGALARAGWILPEASSAYEDLVPWDIRERWGDIPENAARIYGSPLSRDGICEWDGRSWVMLDCSEEGFLGGEITLSGTCAGREIRARTGRVAGMCGESPAMRGTFTADIGDGPVRFDASASDLPAPDGQDAAAIHGGRLLVTWTDGSGETRLLSLGLMSSRVIENLPEPGEERESTTRP